MLIKCSECEKEISDKASSCPHCGCPITNNEPIENLQKVEVTAINIKSRNPKAKKIIIIIFSSILVLCLATFSFFAVRNAQAEKKEKQIYLITLETVNSTLEFSSEQSEQLCALTQSVWRNTIYDEADTETDAYRKDKYGRLTEDFNVALVNLYADKKTQLTVELLISGQNIVEAALKDLKNPPEEFVKCYDALEALYPTYKSLTDLAISPTGSLESYTSNKNSKVDEFTTAYSKFKLNLPEFETTTSKE